MRYQSRAVLAIPSRLFNHVDEALSLAETAEYKVESIVKVRVEGVIKKGTLEKLREALEKAEADVLIYYGSLKPSSAFTVMKELKVKLVDRVMLILEIFARHASSREALLQIEAARIRHEIPLIREFVRRSKMGELPGFLGPGRYAIDEYYRHLNRRLSRIRTELELIKRVRESRLEARRRHGMLHVAIVGYASAGKTTLFNRLTGLSLPVGPEYFTTMHPKHAAIRGLNSNVKVVAVDTVGFIRDVPPEIVEAFHATLAEIKYADTIIFVVDVSEPLREIVDKVEAGFHTMARIGALGRPTLIALNKIDVAENLRAKVKELSRLASKYPGVEGVIEISAARGYGLSDLLDALKRSLNLAEPPGSR